MSVSTNYSRQALAALAASALSASAVATAGCAPTFEPAASTASSGLQSPALQAQAQAPAAASAARPAPAVPGNLDDYIARAEPSFAWKEESREGNATLLSVTSQEWQGTRWQHKVEVVRPAREAVPGAAMLVINFGNPTPQLSFVAQIAANAAGVTVVNLYNVPNQPLWGQREDGLIAYTFAKYLEAGDAASDWPLLLPMAKSATQAMRAVEEWSNLEAKAGGPTAAPGAAPITRWGISGASKRGWTTWLVAAAEAKAHPGRVLGIVPMVYDNLNLGLQMPHQKESWGAYSEMIADYARRGLPDIVGTPKGRALAAIVDPWTYRERLSLPKLIVNASNDAYWPLDSLGLYRSGLSGPTSVFYAPNSGHVLNGNEARVAGISAAWFKMIAQQKTPPQVLAHIVDAQDKPADAPSGEVLASRPGLKWRLQVLGGAGAPATPRAVKVWAASSATRDLRKSRWQSIDLKPAAGQSAYEIALDDPRLGGEGEFHALFGEAELPGGIGDDAPAGGAALKIPFALSSGVTLWK